MKSITDHGERVYTVDLKPSIPVPSFRPGQFLHLTVDDYDPSSFWPESRVFSIASSPRDRSHIRICYSVKGRYTTKMEQRLKVEATVWIKLPYGEFVIDDAHDSVLIAGGTGISAFTAFLESLTPTHPRKITLVYGARTPSLFLFRDLIQKVPNLDAIYFAESDAQPPCLSGRISLDTIWPLLIRPQSSVFYLSGPPVMLKALGDGLRARGISAAQIRVDAWE